MEEVEKRDSQHIAKEFLKIDQICFQKCIRNYEKAQNVKEEACLKNCIAKLINAVDFLHSVNVKGGVDRAPFKGDSGFWQ